MKRNEKIFLLKNKKTCYQYTLVYSDHEYNGPRAIHYRLNFRML
jgi:hypothetical protein